MFSKSITRLALGNVKKFQKDFSHYVYSIFSTSNCLSITVKLLSHCVCWYLITGRRRNMALDAISVHTYDSQIEGLFVWLWNGLFFHVLLKNGDYLKEFSEKMTLFLGIKIAKILLILQSHQWPILSFAFARWIF